MYVFTLLLIQLEDFNLLKIIIYILIKIKKYIICYFYIKICTLKLFD